MLSTSGLVLAVENPSASPSAQTHVEVKIVICTIRSSLQHHESLASIPSAHGCSALLSATPHQSQQCRRLSRRNTSFFVGYVAARLSRPTGRAPQPVELERSCVISLLTGQWQNIQLAIHLLQSVRLLFCQGCVAAACTLKPCNGAS